MTTPAAPAETEPLRRTPLHEVHRAAGARMVPFAGWEMPVQYAGVLPEVRAVRESAGLFDVSHMGRVRVRGRDALAYLQFLTVGDVSRLPEAGGTAQYSLLCLESGGVIDDIIVYRAGGEEFVVVINASNRPKDLAWMRHHAVGFNVSVQDESDATGLLALQGPRAVALANELSDTDLPSVARFGFVETDIAGVPVTAARTGYTGEDGFEMFCPADRAADLWTALVGAGATPCGLGARDTLRLEAALPLYGHEMDEDVSPYEARLSWVVKLDKEEDFVGKAALTEIKAAARRRTLVGIEMEGRAIPREGYSLLASEEGGHIVGHVTSGTFSPMRGKGIALARVDAAHAAKNTALDVLIRDTRHPARVVALPFYKNV
jgi:aminomethyltransferase